MQRMLINTFPVERTGMDFGADRDIVFGIQLMSNCCIEFPVHDLNATARRTAAVQILSASKLEQ